MKLAAITVVLVLSAMTAGCMTNTYNCNVKDACRTSGDTPK